MRQYSWKTTLAGVAGILTGLGMLGKIVNDFGIGQPVHYEDVAIAITTISGGIGLLFARDNNVTSEGAGAK
jgi:hypothetical protein